MLMDDAILAKVGLVPLPVGQVRSQIGRALYDNASHIFAWPRSITGGGVRQTLDWIGTQVDGLKVTELPTGTKCFDWTVPDEWNLECAWIEGPSGGRVVDTADTNLHVLGYSVPVDQVLSRTELDEHLFSLPDMPDAVPYVTSYYRERWGFCVSQNQRDAMPDGDYRAVVKATRAPGSLSLAQIVIPGLLEDEIVISTYTCHPSMANNETSGIVVATMIARWLQSLPSRRYTYRIVFCPETIGSIAFLSLRYAELNDRIRAGFVLTMLGDDRGHTCTLTPRENTLADRVATHVINRLSDHPTIRDHVRRASDERQYCAPGIDWPVVSLMRVGTYPEYHTSADDLDLISPAGLVGGFDYARHCIAALEQNVTPKWKVQCEPHLSKYGLRGTLGGPRKLPNEELLVSHLLAFADGKRDLLSIAEEVGIPIWEAAQIFQKLHDVGLLEAVDPE